MDRPVIPLILVQHAEDAQMLWMQRCRAVTASHYALRHLERLDLRLAAHLDGLCVGLQSGAAFPRDEDRAMPGTLFAEGVATLTATPAQWPALMERCAALGSEEQEELAAALGWASASDLRGVGKALLESPQPFSRWLGISACALHRADPGQLLLGLLKDDDAAVRGRAARAVGELGRVDLSLHVLNMLQDQVPMVRYWAAWAAVLLGDRAHGLALLQRLAMTPNPLQMRSLRLVLRALPLDAAYGLLQHLNKDPAQHRNVMVAAGVLGDGRYLPWLIKQMADPKHARVAGEAFSLATGLDLAWLDLEQKRPAGFESGPTDNPEDTDVSMDEEDDLPWPDPQKLAAWWSANAGNYAEGVRHFMGEPLNGARCGEVLHSGYQRQRIAAAQFLCLLHPGTALFNTAAPTWRQQRTLASSHPQAAATATA